MRRAGAAGTGNFHPFPQARGCTLTPVPSSHAALDLHFKCLCVGSQQPVGTGALASITLELPVASPPKRGGAGLEGIRLRSQLLPHPLHDAHSIHAGPCIYVCELYVVPNCNETAETFADAAAQLCRTAQSMEGARSYQGVNQGRLAWPLLPVVPHAQGEPGSRDARR